MFLPPKYIKLAMFFWYLVQRYLCVHMYSSLHFYTSHFYKVPEKHGHVCPVGLYLKFTFSGSAPGFQRQKVECMPHCILNMLHYVRHTWNRTTNKNAEWRTWPIRILHYVRHNWPQDNQLERRIMKLINKNAAFTKCCTAGL